MFSYTGRDHIRRSKLGLIGGPTNFSHTMVFKLLLQPHKPEFVSLRILPVVGVSGASNGQLMDTDSFDTAVATLAESWKNLASRFHIIPNQQ